MPFVNHTIIGSVSTKTKKQNAYRATNFKRRNTKRNVVKWDTHPPFRHHSTRNQHHPSDRPQHRDIMAHCRDQSRPVQTHMQHLASRIKQSRSYTPHNKLHKAAFTRLLRHWQPLTTERRHQPSGHTHHSTNRHSVINSTSRQTPKQLQRHQLRHSIHITITNWRIHLPSNKNNIIERLLLRLVSSKTNSKNHI